jgi:hypothetical protein
VATTPQFRRRKRRSTAILAVIFALAGGLTVWAGDEAPGAPRTVPGFEADAEHATCDLGDDGVWTLPADSVVLRLTPLTDDERQRYLKKVVGTDSDPFLSRPDTDGFHTFLLQAENHGKQSVLFDPAKCWQQSRSSRIWLPIDLPEMMEAYRLIESEFPPAYEKAANALLQLPIYLDPGEREQGLMIYQGVPSKTRSFTIDLEISDTRGEKISCKAYYRKARKEKSGDGKDGKAE